MGTWVPPGSELRKGTNEVSTNGVTANCRDFLVLPLNLDSPEYQDVPFPNPAEFVTFAAAPLVLTPFVCNQLCLHVLGCCGLLGFVAQQVLMGVCVYVCVYISLSLSIYICIYIYIEREREVWR